MEDSEETSPEAAADLIRAQVRVIVARLERVLEERQALLAALGGRHRGTAPEEEPQRRRLAALAREQARLVTVLVALLPTDESGQGGARGN